MNIFDNCSPYWIYKTVHTSNNNSRTSPGYTMFRMYYDNHESVWAEVPEGSDAVKKETISRDAMYIRNMALL